VVIEGAGGLYSPMAQQVLNSDFAVAINLPMVIVVKDELGAINQALLSIEAAKKHKLNIAMLVLNQITPNSLDNAKALSAYTDVDVFIRVKMAKVCFLKTKPNPLIQKNLKNPI
jgi:dethiobiotin synthetase